MKSFAIAALLACASAISAIGVSARGINYDPAHNMDVTVAAINKDLDLIKAQKFTTVRTFYTKFGNTDLGTLAIQKGLSVSLGIPFSNSDPGASQVHIDVAIATAKKFQNNGARVLHIFVGNENLASTNSVPPKMVEYINKIKAAVPSNVEVGTVQRNTELLDPSRINAVKGMKELFAACKVVGVNIHPVFTPNTAADRAIDQVKAQWSALHGGATTAAFPGIAAKLAITETGWPSAGTMNGNTGTIAGAKAYYNAYKSWSKTALSDARSFYFQMFDQPQRTDGPFEPFFGVATANGAVKFPL